MIIRDYKEDEEQPMAMKVGDNVRLKVGGPTLVISEKNRDGTFICQHWIIREADQLRMVVAVATHSEDELVKVKADDAKR